MDLKSLTSFNRRHIHRRKNDSLEGLRREFYQLLDYNPFHEVSLHSVRVDMHEDKGGVTISAEIPGVKDEDISVSLYHEMLTIKGEKKSKKEEKGESYYMSERSFGSFTRSLRLPYEAETNKVEAEFDNGVLTIRIPRPKSHVAAEKNIKIKKKK
jgi:HSP20 family protein